jgi:trigger factor
MRGRGLGAHQPVKNHLRREKSVPLHPFLNEPQYYLYMKVTSSNSSANTLQLVMHLKESDFAPKVESTLKSYRKTANVPGFRKGHVPYGMIVKMYGPSVRMEEINRAMQAGIRDFFAENTVKTLGSPLLTNENEVNWEGGDMELHFEVGLSPEISIDLSKVKLTRHKISLDKAYGEKYLDRMAETFGKMSEPEVAEQGDVLTLNVQEVDGAGEPVEGGIQAANKRLETKELEHKELLKAIKGKQKGDTFDLEIKGKGFPVGVGTSLFNLSADNLSGLKATIRFEVVSINRVEPAEMNQELWDKVFGEGEVKSKADAIAKAIEIGERNFAPQSDIRFFNEATERLIEGFGPELPDEFLKRWLVNSGETELTAEQVEAEYPSYRRGTQWQLIEAHLAEANEIRVTREEVVSLTKRKLSDQLVSMGQLGLEDEWLDKYAENVLENQEEFRKLSEEVANEKMIDLFKEKCKVKEKEVSLEKFYEQGK